MSMQNIPRSQQMTHDNVEAPRIWNNQNRVREIENRSVQVRHKPNYMKPEHQFL